ncbi:hypothetical protein BJ912DRAFT_866001, partial [Pholiota molesta]
IPIVDEDGRVCALLGGRPNAPDWDVNVQQAAAQRIEDRRCQLVIPEDLAHTRRGCFPAIPVGISHGNGRKKPGLHRNEGNEPILRELLQHSAFDRISGFANHLFKAYNGRLYDYYGKMLDDLLIKQPELSRNHPGTVFACSSINFGPKTVSYPHIDYRNLSWGWCSVTALGSYNPEHGGHLVMWDLGYAIQFPPGSTILLPSAMICHSNTTIGENETRYSYAQYTSGDLFRWVANGHKNDNDWFLQASTADKALREEARKQRWAEGLGMISLVEEFQ